MRHSSTRSALVGACCFVVLFIFSGAAMGEAPIEGLDCSLPAQQAEIQQFKTGGHVLGFSSDRVYMVGLGYALIEEFVGASGARPVAGKSQKPEPLRDSDVKDMGAPAFQGVTYPELWEGITLRYGRAAGGLAESVYVVQPGADAGNIRIRYNADFEIEEDGGLRFQHLSQKGYFRLTRPIAWQEIEGRRVPVEVAFKDHGDRNLGFTVGAWDPDHALVIDPVYQWHTFYGAPAGHDYGYGIAVADDGVYVTGYSEFSWQGDGNADPIHSKNGSTDIFILKLSTAGAYQWHTFYGSTSHDYGYAIAVSGDDVFVTGYSAYYSWAGEGDTAPLHPHSGDFSDIFVMKLDNNGTYQWHTFYGSNSSDVGRDVSVSADGVYVTGESAGSWQGDGDTSPLHAHGGGIDIHVLKLTHAGAYQWHTFYGSTSQDYGGGITVAEDGLYVAAHSYYTWQGDENTSPLHPHGGNHNITVLKLSSSGVYQWHTFYGSGRSTKGDHIAVQGDGIYVTGSSFDSWQGDGGASPEHPHSESGGNDIVVLRLSNIGAYQWHTFYGPGSGLDIAVDSNGVYVTGTSIITWQGDGETEPLHAHSGDTVNIMVLKLFDGPTYTVTYDANGATNGTAPEDQTKLHGQDLTLQVNTGNLSLDNHDFSGWNTAPDGSGVDYAEGAVYTANEAATLYAKWAPVTYTVTYDANGATNGTAPENQVKTYGEDLTLRTNTDNLAKTGHTFGGWNTQADGLGTDYTEGALYTANEAVTLYAKWTLNTYAVIYDANGADSGTAPADQIKTHGVDLTLAENTGNLARTGYTFAGWNTQTDGLGTDYTEGALYTANEAVTLYAKWVSNRTITVSANPTDGGTATGSGTYVDGSIATVNGSAESEYVFVHWTEGNTIVSCSPEYMFTVTGNRTLQANFSQMQNSYDITGSARPSNYGMVTGSGSYNHEAIVTMTALPNQGFALTNWIETWPGLAGSCVVSTVEQYSFQATRNRNLTANIRPKALPGVLMLLLDDE